ncbi:glyoxalase family protein [Curvularia clavata]|uniref:Glyoxalase family protein n=1 Tax=Curvularia clavata TaxID=95742 RepID=A0A9Q8Z8F5_CURCL|nr:glyoxalase family protein [Curvularia clavata]
MTPPVLEGNKFCNTAIRVKNIDGSTSFYVGVLGMKELYRMALQNATLVWLGYPNCADDSTPLSRREGVLELVAKKLTLEKDSHVDDQHDHSNSHPIKLAFHVADLPQFMERVKQQNIKVLKEVGAAEAPEAVASFMGCTPTDLKSDAVVWESLKEVCFVEDPDGYLVEIVPY